MCTNTFFGGTLNSYYTVASKSILKHIVSLYKYYQDTPALCSVIISIQLCISHNGIRKKVEKETWDRWVFMIYDIDIIWFKKPITFFS